MTNKILLFLTLFMVYISLISASQYYADITIDVSESGAISISGNTNHPELQNKISQDYTSKDGNLWILNLSLENEFSQYYLEIEYPKYAKINYIKIPNILNIDQNGDRIIISSTAKNEQIRILTQYSINYRQKYNYLIYIIPLLIILVITAVIIRNKRSKKNKKKYNTDAFTDRQKQIFDLLIKNNGSVTQAYLQKEINIPKASLSRNIDSLIRKNIIIKESKGMTNLIMLKK